MKKLLFSLMMMLGIYSAVAQEFSIQAGYLLTNNHIPDVEASQGDQAFVGYGEFSSDFIKSDNAKFGPVAKVFFYDNELGREINEESNNYAFSAGLEAGFALSPIVELSCGFELPIPDQREGLFEAVISPSLKIGKASEKVNFKINYDYFINKQLFTYQGAVTAGLVFNF